MYFDPTSISNDLEHVVSYYNKLISKLGMDMVSEEQILNELENQINFI